jgi:hypothetical protein
MKELAETVDESLGKFLSDFITLISVQQELILIEYAPFSLFNSTSCENLPRGVVQNPNWLDRTSTTG